LELIGINYITICKSNMTYTTSGLILFQIYFVFCINYKLRAIVNQ